MSGLRITITDKNVASTLRDLLQKAENPAPIFDAVGDNLANLARLNFVEGSDPYGQAWRHPVFRSGQPLRDTGRLMTSITHKADKTGVAVGTNVCYAATHQTGATISATPGQSGSNSCGPRKGSPFLAFKTPGGMRFAKSVTIPARPFIPTQERGLPDHWWQETKDTIAAMLGFKQ